MSEGATILQVIPRLDAGGAELSTLEMVEALHDTGARALVATHGGRMAKDVERLGGELIMMDVESKNPWCMWRNGLDLAAMIENEQIDLVHARSRAPAWSCYLAARRAKCSFVTTYHGAYNERNRVKKLYNSVMARADRVIANSHYTADLVRGRHGIDPSRLRVIYRGVDVARFARSAIAPERMTSLRERWKIGEAQNIVLHPARLTSWKGQGVVIEAAARLRDREVDGNWVFILAGDHQGRDNYLEGLRSWIEVHSLQDKVRLVGHCDDMAAAYALARVTLIASIEPEAFGRTSAEAQALGCPVIATDIGAPPETVRAVPHVGADGITGWLVPPGDPVALADILGEALALPQSDYETLSQRAIENVRRSFTDQRMKLDTLKVYDELLGTALAARLG